MERDAQENEVVRTNSNTSAQFRPQPVAKGWLSSRISMASRLPIFSSARLSLPPLNLWQLSLQRYVIPSQASAYRDAYREKDRTRASSSSQHENRDSKPNKSQEDTQPTQHLRKMTSRSSSRVSPMDSLRSSVLASSMHGSRRARAGSLLPSFSEWAEQGDTFRLGKNEDDGADATPCRVLRSSGLRSSARSSRSNSSPATINPVTASVELTLELRATLGCLASACEAPLAEDDSLCFDVGARALLAEGTFASVYLVRKRASGSQQEVKWQRQPHTYQALKVVEKFAVSPRVCEYIRAEADVHKELRHPYIVSMCARLRYVVDLSHIPLDPLVHTRPLLLPMHTGLESMKVTGTTLCSWSMLQAATSTI